jgi:hypothetical protein
VVSKIRVGAIFLIIGPGITLLVQLANLGRTVRIALGVVTLAFIALGLSLFLIGKREARTTPSP